MGAEALAAGGQPTFRLGTPPQCRNPMLRTQLAPRPPSRPRKRRPAIPAASPVARPSPNPPTAACVVRRVRLAVRPEVPGKKRGGRWACRRRCTCLPAGRCAGMRVSPPGCQKNGQGPEGRPCPCCGDRRFLNVLAGPESRFRHPSDRCPGVGRGVCVWARLAVACLRSPPAAASSRVDDLGCLHRPAGRYALRIGSSLKLGVRGLCGKAPEDSRRTRGRAVREVTSDAF